LTNPENPSLVDALRRRRQNELTEILAHVVNLKVFGSTGIPVLFSCSFSEQLNMNATPRLPWFAAAE
jgi:hypothetical protein